MEHSAAASLPLDELNLLPLISPVDFLSEIKSNKQVSSPKKPKISIVKEKWYAYVQFNILLTIHIFQGSR